MKIATAHELFKVFNEIAKNYIITNYDGFINLLHDTGYTYSSKEIIGGYVELNAKNDTYKISAKFNIYANTLQIEEIINIEDFEEKILPCRKCGSIEYTYDDYNGVSSEATLHCNICNNHESVQICDVLQYNERYTGNANWQCDKTSIYGKKALKKVKNYLIEEWNKRVL
jgi:hypothetical protein